ncbi:apelin receptor B-like [Porites lutea]|uniref:apelin receptor B-like n=1 Tax=Porites lutea TaxID=51062 RepID=UPI003CC58DB1
MTLAPTGTDSGTIQPETNLSGGDTGQGASQSQNALEVAFSIIASCAFVFNLAFCVVLLKKRAMLKKPHNSLLFNLALTDLLTGAFLILTPGYVSDKPLFPIADGFGGHLFCALLGNRYLLFLVAKESVFLVTCLAVERWYCVMRPMEYKKHFGRKRLLIYIVVSWIASCALQSHKFLEQKLSGNKCVPVDVPYGREGAQAFISVKSVSTFVIPCFVTWLTFAHIKFRAPVYLNDKSSHSERRERQQKLVLRMCALTAFVVTLCWLPAQLSYTLTPFGITRVSSPFHKAFNVVSLVNSCINPFIYWYYHREYREEFIRLFCFCKLAKKVVIVKQQDVSPSTSKS